MFQRKMGLYEYENQALASAAQACVAELDSNQRATQQLAEEPKQTDDQATVRRDLGRPAACRPLVEPVAVDVRVPRSIREQWVHVRIWRDWPLGAVGLVPGLVGFPL